MDQIKHRKGSGKRDLDLTSGLTQSGELRWETPQHECAAMARDVKAFGYVRTTLQVVGGWKVVLRAGYGELALGIFPDHLPLGIDHCDIKVSGRYSVGDYQGDMEDVERYDYDGCGILDAPPDQWAGGVIRLDIDWEWQ